MDNEEILNKKIFPDRSREFRFPRKITDEFGDFSVSYQDPLVEKIPFFTLEDIKFISAPYDKLIQGSIFFEDMQKEGYFPLDAMCAKALFKDEEYMDAIKHLWFKKYCEDAFRANNFHIPWHLRCITFFGTHFMGGPYKHFICIDYEKDLSNGVNPKPMLMPYEDDLGGWGMGHDFALVFKKKFIEKLSLAVGQGT